jgi:hypothetical protein
MMTGNAMSLLPLVAEQFSDGLTWQQEVGTRVQSVTIVTLNAGDRMMTGSATRNVQLIGYAFLLEIDTRVPLQQTDP